VATPPVGRVLDGISLRVVRELCGESKVAFVEQDLTLDDVRSAGEVMLCGTAFCVAGVSWVEGRAIGWPGPVTSRLQRAWGDVAGLDFVAQTLG
jgi:D-alanine transaminase